MYACMCIYISYIYISYIILIVTHFSPFSRCHNRGYLWDLTLDATSGPGVRTRIRDLDDRHPAPVDSWFQHVSTIRWVVQDFATIHSI